MHIFAVPAHKCRGCPVFGTRLTDRYPPPSKLPAGFYCEFAFCGPFSSGRENYGSAFFQRARPFCGHDASFICVRKRTPSVLICGGLRRGRDNLLEMCRNTIERWQERRNRVNHVCGVTRRILSRLVSATLKRLLSPLCGSLCPLWLNSASGFEVERRRGVDRVEDRVPRR